MELNFQSFFYEYPLLTKFLLLYTLIQTVASGKWKEQRTNEKQNQSYQTDDSENFLRTVFGRTMYEDDHTQTVHAEKRIVLHFTPYGKMFD